MRNISLLFLVLGLALPAYALETWITFQDEAATFSVEMPEAPKIVHSPSTLNDGSEIPTSTYSVDHGDVGMLVMVADSGKIDKDPAQVLDDTVGGIAEGKTLISKVNDVVDGRVGRYAKISDKDGNLYNDRVFYFDGKLYQFLTIEFPAASPEKRAEVERFIKSAHFPAKQKTR